MDDRPPTTDNKQMVVGGLSSVVVARIAGTIACTKHTRADTDALEQLLQILRATEEWPYVEREIDIRLTRAE